MILEVATLNVRQGQAAEFEKAFALAKTVVAKMPGYVSHELRRCLEVENKYLLLVRWQQLKDRTEGFRKSTEYPVPEGRQIETASMKVVRHKSARDLLNRAGAWLDQALDPGKKNWEFNTWPYLLKSDGEALLRKP